jgi:hypothetical protein
LAEAPEAGHFTDESSLIVAEGLAPVALELMRACGAEEPETFELFRSITLEMQFRSMAAPMVARGVLHRLDEARIPVAVIKGPAVARFHPEGWPRTYSDVDLLVPPRHFFEVVRLCEGDGFENDVSQPRWPWFDLYCKEGVNLHLGEVGNIDVHHHVPPWVFGAKLDVDAVLRTATMGTVGGAPVHLADASYSLIVAALHVLNDLWKGRLGLTSWRDILVLLHHVGINQAEQAFATVHLEWLLDLVTSSIAAGVSEAEVAQPRRVHSVPILARARIAMLGWNNASISRQQASWAARLPAPRALAFLAGCVVPEPKYVREHFGSYRQYWRSLFDDTLATMHGADHRMQVHDHA